MATSPALTADEVNVNIRSMVRLLRAARDVSIEKLAEVIGVSRTAMYGRLREPGEKDQTEFLAAEVYLLAQFFDVDQDLFFRPLAEVIVGAPAPGLEPGTLWFAAEQLDLLAPSEPTAA